MKKILVAADFSASSKNAFHYATRLGAFFNARITLLHVSSPVDSDPWIPVHLYQSLTAQKQEIALKYFSEWENSIPQNLRNTIELECSVRTGNPVEEIIAESESARPDLIVVGMQKGHLLRKKILGSTATGVIQRVLTPVLIVPEFVRFQSIRQLGYATNFEKEDIRALDTILDLARSCEAEIHCIHVQKNNHRVEAYQESILKQVYRDDMKMDKLDFDHINHSSVVQGLNQYVQNHQIDLLVMLTHHRSLFSQLFHHSNTRQMALQSQVPLLVFQVNQPAIV